MGYASIISLKNTIHHLLNSSHILLVTPSSEIIQLAYKQLESLQEVLKKLDISNKGSSRKRVNALDAQIREAVSKVEDVIESQVLKQILSQSEESINGDGIRLSIDLEDLKQDIRSLVETLKKMEEEYKEALGNMLPEEDDYDDAVSSRADFGGKKPKIVGLCDQFCELKDLLTSQSNEGPSPYQQSKFLRILKLSGMAGIGKTTLARKIFEDPDILEFFNCRVWVTQGRKYRLEEIRRCIVAQVDSDMDKMLIMEGDAQIVRDYLKERLKGKRFLIVLDDVWDLWVWDDLINSLPLELNGNRVLLTTRLRNLHRPTMKYVFDIETQLLNKEESWELLHEKVFGEELCPPQLEKAGKKIAENCEGLPLMIITVADLLSKAKKTPEYWNRVAEKQNSLFMDAYGEISKVLYPSYNYLDQHLKACFLYMGVFPQNYKIPRSKLIDMWTVEGFLEPNMLQASRNLEELVWNSLVVVHQNVSEWANQTKSCSLHSSFWHLCNREAGKNKFFHLLNSLADGLAEGIESQRRLCIHNNILFGIKSVYNLMEDDCASTARSLLCYGPYHQYQVTVCFGLRLLRVLDALTIRFYEFPMEVLRLVQLRYLALTYNGKLPTSISKLWNLHFLIIRQHLNIKSRGAPSHVPMEIWDMQELKHIQIMGSDLPNPNHGAFLQNLLKLLDVSAHSCTKGVLKRIPNLRKLGIQIQLVPDDSKPLHCLNHISCLHRLESLRCVIVNPQLRPEFVLRPPTISKFPSSLRKLHLSGLGYPWEYISIVGSLPNLTVLKLRHYAFRGPKWETEENTFLSLSSLLIEDTDLIQWKVGCGSFPWLRRLSIKHCYKLEEVHEEFRPHLEKIEVIDCNRLPVAWMKEIKARPRQGYPDLDVYVHSSWDDRNLKS